MHVRNPSKILIVNDKRDMGFSYTPLMERYGDVVKDVEEFSRDPFNIKLILFTGGSDVSPEYYGDTSPKGVCSCNPSRDEQEKRIFNRAVRMGIKMIGICRGLQFLNVMSGGKMIHHLGYHSGQHNIRTCRSSMDKVMVNSAHHQACIPAMHTNVLAWAEPKLSEQYIGDEDRPIYWPGPEVEALYNSLDRWVGFQWHPEAMPKETAGHKLFHEIVNDFVELNKKGFENIHCAKTDKMRRSAAGGTVYAP